MMQFNLVFIISFPLPISINAISLANAFSPITVQDFPIREYKVYLHIKRRRWLNMTTNKVVYRDWNIVAKGTRLTQEFATFLKEINRY
ncbi:transposase family protein [Flavobacterium sp. SUN046]|uniref:ISAon1 family transposase N-terminal region protein n=1 Tax=Flavobacterium sp. SUN046 TaxID=3002440 RepID=UPI002DB61FE1|nr:transposase family protein [Flavobacterium sp. SUN046]MEC4050114.1 transposase family protein [Flavobacterium sp. SUN046]